jgi:hypothetical protein
MDVAIFWDIPPHNLLPATRWFRPQLIFDPEDGGNAFSETSVHIVLHMAVSHKTATVVNYRCDNLKSYVDLVSLE